MKETWIKNLAQSTFRNNCWTHPNPDQLKEKSTTLLLQTVDDILEKSIATAQIYNNHCSSEKTIKVLTIKPSKQISNGGISLVLGQCQLKVVQHQYSLFVNLEQVKNFQAKQIKTYSFSPRMDQLGAVYWSNEQLGSLTTDQLVRVLFEDLCKLSQY